MTFSLTASLSLIYDNSERNDDYVIWTGTKEEETVSTERLELATVGPPNCSTQEQTAAQNKRNIV